MYWSLTMSSSRQVLVTKSAAVDALQVPRPWDTDATSRPSRSRRCSSTSGRRPRGKRCSAAEHQERWVQKIQLWIAQEHHGTEDGSFFLEPQTLAIDNEFVERALGAYTLSPLSLQLEHEKCTLRL